MQEATEYVMLSISQAATVTAPPPSMSAASAIAVPETPLAGEAMDPARSLNRQEFYRQQYRLSHHWKDSLALYCEVIDGYVQTDTHVLDIGCGHGDFLAPVYSKTPHTYGIDPDAQALAKNTIVRNTVVGSADALPFPDNFFDLVVSAWVLEHLDRPEQAFREVYRVLKPGGRVIFLTPNAWNYNIWIIRLIPNCFHSFFTRRLYNRQEHDTYPVRYQINSPRRIDRTLRPLGFTKAQLILNGDPTYISFNAPLYALACAIERLLSFKWFRAARVHLIGVYQK